MWFEGGDEKGFIEEFVNFVINCVKLLEDREKLLNVCKRLEVRNILKLFLFVRLYLDVRRFEVKRFNLL